MSENEKNENKPAEETKPAADKPAAEKPAAAAPAAPAAPVRPAPPKNPVEDELRAKFGDAIELKYGYHDLEVHAKPENLLAVSEFLKTRAAGPYTFLRNLTAVDWKDAGEIETVFHISTFPNTAVTVCVKCRTSRDNASVPSVTHLWPSANWLEREVFDLLGVNFTGHPDLRRIMLPDEWEGHPLRKDYVHKEPELPCRPR